MPHVRSLLFLVIALAITTPAAAQWLKLPTPGIPRLADGKPNLAAPTPRTADGKPDFSGLWRNDGGDRLYNNVAVDLRPGDVAPWADAIYRKRRLEFGKDSMETRCLPLGPAYLTTRYRTMRFVQTPTLLAIEFDDGMHRNVFMDGRTLEPDPNPTWMGYSVGRWDGDVLVVESNGYTDRSWLDWDGHPHTEALRITERYARRDFGRIDVSVSMADPKAYPNGIHFTIPIKFQPDTELLESFCENNAASLARMAKTAPAEVVDVPVATLSGYVGVYDLVDETNGSKTVAAITLDGATLSLDYDAKGKEVLIPLSPTRFSWSGSVVEFVTSRGSTPAMVIHYAENDERGPRRK